MRDHVASDKCPGTMARSLYLEVRCRAVKFRSGQAHSLSDVIGPTGKRPTRPQLDGGNARDMLCMAGSAPFPLSGMVLMYVLMSTFHLAPWLKLFSRRSSARQPEAARFTRSTASGDAVRYAFPAVPLEQGSEGRRQCARSTTNFDRIRFDFNSPGIVGCVHSSYETGIALGQPR